MTAFLKNTLLSVKNRRGSTTVEMAMVMTILVLFGMTIYTLICSGADTQERITKEKDAQTDARIALSYINVRLRQNDSAGKIGIEKLELTGKDALVIKERSLESEYDTWIFCAGGRLLECLTDAGVPPTEIDSYYIVDAEDLDTEFDSETGAVTNTVYYQYGDQTQSLSSTVHLRSYYAE